MSNSRTKKQQVTDILTTYVTERQAKEKYTGTIFGYSKDKKIAAANALIDFIKNETNPREMYSHLSALRQGTLKSIWTIFKTFLPALYEVIKYEESQIKNPTPYQGEDKVVGWRKMS